MDKEIITRNTVALLAHLLDSKAAEARMTAEMWKKDPQEYGADDEQIGWQRGLEQAYKNAAGLVRDYLISR